MSRQTPDQLFFPYGEFIPNFGDFCKKLSDPLPVHLRVNTLKASVSETRRRLERHGLSVVPEDPIGMVLRVRNLAQPGHLPEYALGHLHSQALSSVLAGLALDPAPGDLVLDLCAAPGSKTSLLAQLMENKGIIVANDRNTNRLVALQTNLKRLAITNTITTRYLGQYFPKKIAFDRVLVDAPCSAEGTLRTGPDDRVRFSVQPNKKLFNLQHALVLRAFDLLAPGGSLIYSTCTYNPDENEGVVKFLLDNRPAKIQAIALDVMHSPGLKQWQEVSYDASMQSCWRIYPHETDTVGFFLARVGRGA